ncbi:glutamate-gated chloride channel-like [Penaeus japonicus]|uniref:glutamate-gated chloride channel-like n=1 Tax=Penaeus japonicus TaxID=27405 RepID=UPI001C71658A|nr:glutamate-gated chloride channel-like [Penaeus japonicus]
MADPVFNLQPRQEHGNRIKSLRVSEFRVHVFERRLRAQGRSLRRRDDCSDLSDEDDCRITLLPKGYRTERPPENRTADGVSYLGTTVEILRFMDISDVKRLVNVEFVIELTWTGRSTSSLRDAMEWNQLHTRDQDSVWRPQLKFPNVLNGDISLLSEDVFLKKIGRPEPADFNDVRMDIIYSGEEAILIQKQQYSGSFSHSFDGFYYPFDTQRCSILLQLSDRSELVRFRSWDAQVIYQEDLQLPSYVINDYQVIVTERGNDQTRYSVLKVEIELTRRRKMIVMSVYVPTLMLLLIGYSTLFVKVSLMQVRLVVSLTTLLVLYTLFNNTSNALPVTDYVKMIDLWFFHCIFLLFFIILSHVFVDHLDTKGQDLVQIRPANGSTNPKEFVQVVKKPELLLKVLRIYVLPVVSLCFNVVYWAVLLGSQKA